MRLYSLSFLLLFTLHAAAQCCCTDILLYVSVGDHPEGDYAAAFHPQVSPADADSTDGLISFHMDAGCGLAERVVSLTRRSTGEQMELHVLFVGHDGGHPMFRVPFTPGVFDIDLERIINCGNTQALVKETTDGPGSSGKGIVDCGGWKVGWERALGQITFELFDLRTGVYAPGSAEDAGTGKAHCTGGKAGFQTNLGPQFEEEEVSRGIWRSTYTGIAYVTEDGGFGARMDKEQTNKVYALEMVPMKCTAWQPARIPDAGESDGFRNIGSMVRYRFVLK